MEKTEKKLKYNKEIQQAQSGAFSNTHALLIFILLGPYG